jgi:CBS domain-containing protein
VHTSALSQRPGFPSAAHTAPPEIPAHDAARLMAWRKVGAILVVEDHRPVGIITDRDLATRVLGNGLDARSIKIGRVMTAPVVTMKVEERDEDIQQRLLSSRIRQIPLVNGTGQVIALATYEPSADGGMVVVRSTVLLPMMKRKAWRRLVFGLQQDLAANLRWIGVTVALAAIGGAVSLMAAGYWTPWRSPQVASSVQPAPLRLDRARPAEPPRPADEPSPGASTVRK